MLLCMTSALGQQLSSGVWDPRIGVDLTGILELL